jgi:ADP-ribose pyrophosphatase YjhB (NUDIX family)
MNKPTCQLNLDTRQDINELCFGVILDISENWILIVKEKQLPHLQRWGLPKGHFKMGETSVQCIKREICEEIGLEFEKYYTLHSRNHNIHYFVILKPWSEIKLTLGEEVDKVQWVNIDWLKNDIRKDIQFAKMSRNYTYKYNMSIRNLFSK